MQNPYLNSRKPPRISFSKDDHQIGALKTRILEAQEISEAGGNTKKDGVNSAEAKERGGDFLEFTLKPVTRL